MRMKVKEYIAEFLRCQGVGHVFEVAGGMITHLLDAIYEVEAATIISVHHEQAASFAADAYGRCTGNTGIGFATSGPGATNLLTGIASCYFDSTPAIFITGQVNTHEQKGDRPLRQLGFQETDIVAMTTHITKKSYRVMAAEHVETIMKEAYEIAISDRPGPVLIDIPMNLQRVEIEVGPIQKINRKKFQAKGDDAAIIELIEALKAAKKPLILAGGGINAARVSAEFLRLVELLQIPVVSSLLALDLMPFGHPLRVGFIGSYGNRWANLALGGCDLLLVLGSRLDIRQTGADVESFSKNKKIFHVDCDVNEVNNRLKGCLSIIMDVGDFIEKMCSQIETNKIPAQQHWRQEIAELQAKWPDIDELKDIAGINPNLFMHELSRKSQGAAGYVIDVGNHQMWAAQSLEVGAKQFFMTSAGMGSMGFALPAAIGASLAHNKQPVVMIAGDGGFQFNLQELQTVVRNKLPLKLVVINNNSLGMIRQFQDNYFEGRYQSTCWGYSAPNFELIAGAYGVAAKTISQTDQIEAALSWLWEKESEASLLQVMVDLHANAYPKIAFGKPITDMEPFVKPISMEAT